MGNASKEETRVIMMRAVVELMDEGLAVSEISGLAVTEHCGVDKMYVNRYFEDLSGLFLETIQYLLTEQLGSMLSQDVFLLMVWRWIPTWGMHSGLQVTSQVEPTAMIVWFR